MVRRAGLGSLFSRDGGYGVKPKDKPRNSTNNLPDFQSCSKVRKKLDTTKAVVLLPFFKGY